MKTSIRQLTIALDALIAFEAKYQPGERMHCLNVPNLTDKEPGVTFYGSQDHAWIVETFGADDWKTAYKSAGWQHVQKFVDGVKVTFYDAYRIPNETPLPQDVPAHLLTGAEAGIELEATA